MRITVAVLASILVIGAAVFIAPRTFGIAFARTEGTSMNPLLKQGDAVIIHRLQAGASIKTGDIVLYPRNGRFILHRIVREYYDPRGQLMFVTKGDNVPQADDPVAAMNVRGKLIWRVPIVGAMSRALGQDDGYKTIGELAWLTAGLGVLLMGAWWASARRAPAPLEERTAYANSEQGPSSLG